MKKISLRVPATRPRNPLVRAARARHAGAHRDRRYQEQSHHDWRSEWIALAEATEYDDIDNDLAEGDAGLARNRPSPSFMASVPDLVRLSTRVGASPQGLAT